MNIPLPKISLKTLYEKMLTIRLFEEGVLKLFEEGKLFGTTHAYIGQEANAAGIISNLNKSDIVVSNHRCHGHYLAHKNNPYALLCEMMGKKDGLCAGRGGSQHICDNGFFSNGVQGGIMPLAAGLALSEKYNNTKNIVTVFIGDGTLGEGTVYEILNIVSKWELPLFIIVENNRYAQSTKIEQSLAGKISDRFKAFDIDYEEIDTFDVAEVNNKSFGLINEVRKIKSPKCLIINTYRFASHSKSDDGRSQKEVNKWKAKDPLLITERQLEADVINDIQIYIKDFITKEIERAVKAPLAK